MSQTLAVLSTVKLALSTLLVVTFAAAVLAGVLGALTVWGLVGSLVAIVLGALLVAVVLQMIRRQMVGDVPSSPPIGASDVMLFIGGPIACFGMLLGLLGFVRLGYEAWRYTTRA